MTLAPKAAIYSSMETVREKIVRLVLDLKQKREEVATIEAELDRLIPNGKEAHIPAEPRRPNTKGQQIPGSLAYKLLARINSEPTRSFEAEDFAELVEDGKIQMVRSGLLRLLKGSSIVE